MSASPVVSIVTPSLNPGPRLKRCLDSVRSQTYPLIEHIVVDGNSSDGSLDVLQHFPRVKWISERDTGQAAALNKGFHLASGSVVSWLNADDFLKPRAIELAVKGMQSAKAAWVYGNLEILHSDHKDLYIPPTNPEHHLFGLGKGSVIPQPGSLIELSVLHSIGGLDESFKLAMDFDLWVRLLDAKVPYTYVPETLAVFEIHTNSKTGSNPASAFCLEEAASYRKIGRNRLWLLALGRAAAASTFESGMVSGEQLAKEIAGFSAHRPSLRRLELATIRAGARTEAALFELGRAKRRPILLLGLEPWLFTETRKRLFEVALHRPTPVLPADRQVVYE